jgi:hypothetical protein
LFFAHFVILFSLKKLSGAPLTETRVSGFVLQTLRYKKFRRNCDSPPRSSGRLQLLFCVTAERAQKKGREFDPRPLYNLKGDTRATNAWPE